ncbi:hypothetical protein D3C72_1160740 [compost metagenome]
MPKVDAFGPQRCAGNRVEHGRLHAARELRARQGDHAAQDQGEIALVLGRDRADGDDARDVRGAAPILAARVDQQQAVAFDGGRSIRMGVVMHDGAMRIEAGDGAEAGADKVRATGAGGRQVFVDADFRQRRALRVGQGGVQPAEKFAQGGAVLLHGGAHMGRFAVRLARLGQGGRVDGFHHAHALGHGLARAKRDAARVEQQGGAGRQGGQRGRRAVIRGHVDAFAFQGGAQGGRHFAVGDEQRGALRPHQRMCEEDGVVTDVGAAQVEQVRDVVEGGNHMVAGAVGGHAGAQGRQFLRARQRRIRGRMLNHGRGRHGRAIGPDGLQHVGVRAQGHFLTQRLLQQSRIGQAQHGAVDGHRLPRLHGLTQPVDIQHAGAGRDFLEDDAAAGQLVFRLFPVTAIGPHAGDILRHDQGADGTRKARQPLAALPARRQILGQMRVGRWHDQRIDMLRAHGGAQLRQTGGGSGLVRCLHGDEKSGAGKCL